MLDLQKAKNFKDLYKICKGIYPDITQEEFDSEIKKLSEISNEKLEMIVGGGK